MYTITAKKRDPRAKAAQLRRSGIVPCVIFGAGLPQSLPVQLDLNTAKQLCRTLRSGSRVNVHVDGAAYPALIKDLDYNALRGEIVHIGFQALDAEKKVNSVADIVLLNRDKAAGVLELVQMRVPHAAVPDHLLDTVAVDLAGLPAGTTLTIGDIPEFCSRNIELQADPAAVVLHIREKKRISGRPE